MRYKRINSAKHKQIVIEIAKQLLYQDKRCESLKLINHDELIRLLIGGKADEDCKIIFHSYINQITNIETFYNNIEGDQIMKQYDKENCNQYCMYKLKHGWDMKDYEKTLVIKLNINK